MMKNPKRIGALLTIVGASALIVGCAETYTEKKAIGCKPYRARAGLLS
jgi:hypothetical protein